MFQNEFTFKETITTILDDDGQYDDVSLHIDDNDVYIRQWNEEQHAYDIIIMSHKMFLELQQALKHSEGFFRTVI
jgi:hypothetical protein